MRFTQFAAGLATVAAVSFAPAMDAYAQATVKMMVMQEDSDPESLARDNRIQREVLSEFQRVLNAPDYARITQQLGLDGLDVYDETAQTMNAIGNVDKARRTDQELIAIVRNLPDVDMDVALLYTLYAKAVDNPYADFQTLQTSINYRVINVPDGRILGTDTVRTDLEGIPFTGCAANLSGTAADPHCVKEFVAEHAGRIAADASNKIAIELASLLGASYGTGSTQGMIDQSSVDVGIVDEKVAAVQPPVASAPIGQCPAAIPRTYNITFSGVESQEMSAIEEYLDSFACAMELNAKDSSFTQITYEYKTRADQQRLVRNLRMMGELMGHISEVRTQGSNEIVVTNLRLRSN